MVVWLNGPFGGGKTTLAAGLCRALPGAMIAAPEAVGDLLRGTLAGHDRRPRDYQDLPLWRQLTGVFIAGLVRHTGGPVIVPMTVLNPAYAAEVSTPLHQAGGSHHLVVHAAPAALQERIAAGLEFPATPSAARPYAPTAAGAHPTTTGPPPSGCTPTATSSTPAPSHPSRPFKRPSITCVSRPPHGPDHRSHPRHDPHHRRRPGPRQGRPTPLHDPSGPSARSVVVNTAAGPAAGSSASAVFAPPHDRDDQVRMRHAHAAAARTFRVTPTGPDVWGWQGRTLGRRAGQWWLRLVCAPQDKRNLRLWEGTATAHHALPPTVPRPRLHDVLDWSAHGHAYRGELSEYVPLPALQTGGPVLTADLDLPSVWWADLRLALEATSTVVTDRQAVRQRWVDNNITRFLGIPAFQVGAWTTGHGDLHWANLTGPPLVMLDWEGWGLVPVGFDIGLLHAYSLTRPATAARVRHEFAHVLDTPAGRAGELVALAQLLQVAGRGGHPELASHLARRAEHLTGTPVPVL
jgi:hypothetical protein